MASWAWAVTLAVGLGCPMLVFKDGQVLAVAKAFSRVLPSRPKKSLAIIRF